MSLFQAGIQPALDANGDPISGATWSFYETGTLIPAAVYDAPDLVTSLGTAVTALADGRFPTTYLDPAVGYRAILKDALGSIILDVDPYTGEETTTGGGGTVTAPEGPRRLSYGARVIPTSWPEILAEYGNIHLELVGFAKLAGTTGGKDYSVYYVNDPSLDATTISSFGWALDQVTTAGGGGIVFDPAGFFPIILDDRFTLRNTVNNLTMWAPGRNVTLWSPRTKGIFNLFGQNHIYKNINHRPLPGPINLTAITDEKISGAKSLSQCSTETCDKMAWVGCEFDHPSWHALDMTRVTDVTGADPFRATVQNCIIRNAIQGHLIGTHNGVFAATDPSKFTDDDSERQCFVTFYENVWAYNLQRNPKVLGNAYVDVVDCVTILRPYKNEYLADGSDIEESAFGAAVQDGGWLRYRGSYIMSAHAEIDGRPATYLSSVPTWGGASGRISVEDSYADNLVFQTRDAGLIDALPYTLAHTNVAGMTDVERAAWAAGIWAKAGARIDAAPEGIFLPTKTTEIPNGQSLVIDGIDRSKQLIRIDQAYEYALPVKSKKGQYPAEPLSYARHLGKVRGISTGAAIGVTMLDLANPQSGNFTVLGDAGSGNMRSFINTDDEPFTSGMTVQLTGSGVNPTTLKALTTVTGCTADATADTIAVSSHGMTTGDFPITFTTSGTMPGGVTASTAYYVIVVDANTVKLAASYADAIAGSAIDISSAGTGTMTAKIGNLDIGTDLALDSAIKAVVLQYYTTSGRFIIVGGRPS